MRTSLWLRLASAISLLFAVGHLLGSRQSWSPIGESDVLTSMRTFRFASAGVNRTYLDFYLGFGFTVGVFLLMQTMLLWQLAGRSTNDPRQTRSLILTFLLASLANGVLSWKFILPVPVFFDLALVVCLGLALLACGRVQQEAHR